jgi:AcrR family transcriptional regulator
MWNVNNVNISLVGNVSVVNIVCYHGAMPRTPKTPRRTPARPYHHGDLRHALLQEGARLVARYGVDALTLRAVSDRVGVSRSALYRHFADKQALLAGVAAEGFRTLRAALATAWETQGRGAAGFDALGEAYVRFALTHATYYRVMFGGVVAQGEIAGDVDGESTNAFQVLVEAIVDQQRAGLVRPDDPHALALFAWAVVHGVAMLALDGLIPGPLDPETLTAFASARLRTGIGVPRVPASA